MGESNLEEIATQANKAGGTPRVMLTARQKKILDKLSVPMDVKSAALDLGISTAAIYNSNKRVYHNFSGLLDAMVAYYPVFDRRFRQTPDALVKLRKLARKIKPNEGLKI